jgi:anthranilate synthase component 1
MKTYPNQEQFENYVKNGYSVIPVWAEVLADLETPVSVYLKVQDQHPQAGPFFLFESVVGGEKIGRYSSIGLNPAGLITVQNGQTQFKTYRNEIEILVDQTEANPFNALEATLQKLKAPADLQDHSISGLIGAIAYDCVRFVEPINLKVDQELPEAAFLLTGDVIIFDNLSRTIRLLTNIYIPSQKADLKELYSAATERIKNLEKLFQTEIKPANKRIISNDSLEGQETTSNWTSSCSQKEFETIVKTAKEHIVAGDIFQIVLSQQMKTILPKAPDPLHLYRLLRSLNPSPYMFLLDFGDFKLIGSSPEVMVKCSAKSPDTSNEQVALLRPIAGTYRRGQNEAEDLELAEKLKNDPKELAEHLMLIDLARNDLGRVAIPGSVKLTDQMIVEKYSHVLHLVSEVVCNVRPEMNSIDLFKAVFPAGTLSGAPKVKAMQIIADLESVARGFYGGSIGYFGFDGSVNTAMTIRTLTVKDNVIKLQTGAGVVYDSEPAKEYQETLNKGAALLKVVEQASKLT